MQTKLSLLRRTGLLLVASIFLLLPLVSAADSNANVQLYGIVILVAIALLFMEDNAARFFSGTLFIVTGIAFIVVGFQEFTNIFLRNSSAFILIGLGSYLLITAGLRSIQEGW